MELTKQDIATYFEWTNNILDKDIDPHIRRARDKDFKPIVPIAFYDAFLAETCGSPTTELCTFYNDFIKPLWAAFTFQRYLLWAGANVTQFGLVRNLEPTSEPISDKQRGELMNDVQGDINTYLADFYRELNDNLNIFDGVEYDFACVNKKSTLKIRPI